MTSPTHQRDEQGGRVPIKIGSKVVDAFGATAEVVDLQDDQAKLRWGEMRRQVQGSWFPVARLRAAPMTAETTKA